MLRGRSTSSCKSIGRPMDDCGNANAAGIILDLIGSGGSPNRPRAIEVNRPYLPGSWRT